MTTESRESVPRESAPIRMLVASRNIEEIELICQQTHRLSIHVETACDADSATRKLSHAKYEGIIIDSDLGEAGLTLLRKLTNFTANRRAVSFAIVNEDQGDCSAFQSRCTFVMRRPLTSSPVYRTFLAARSMMFRERRRDYRYPIEVPISIESDYAKLAGHSINLSETGIAISAPLQLKNGARITLTLDLPQIEAPLAFCGEVCWSDSTGRAGVQFVDVSRKTLEQLQSWIATRMTEMVPGW